eukprot:m.123420 g.123420  ORF g.123420 m.123420 type:complete len:1850 (+) comp23389_c0_seq2:1097-6646(+)
MYGRLFSWLVKRVNDFLKPKVEMENIPEVGVLDIFGFENFARNSFEQLCINVANEQLQYYFNQHIFAYEQAEIAKEGINVDSIQFQDNKPLLDLFLKRPLGVFSLLDEESFFPRATDITFAEKMHKAFKKQRDYHAPKSARDPEFSIHHYAGLVTYNVTGFLEKNRDTLSDVVQTLLLSSDNHLIRQLFKTHLGPTGSMSESRMGGRAQLNDKTASLITKPLTQTQFRRRDTRRSRRSSGKSRGSNENKQGAGPARLSRMSTRKSRRKSRKNVKPKANKALTVSTHFKNSLADLMTKMMAATPHFVRCVKPNSNAVPTDFDAEKVGTQLKYAGVLETVRIRRDGYPVRLPFEEFVTRYQVLAFPMTMEIPEKDCCAAAVKILATGGIESASREHNTGKKATKSWEIGKSKVFLKYYIATALIEQLEFYHLRATVCQRNMRGWLVRHRIAEEKKRKEEEERRQKEEEERQKREEEERHKREEEEKRQQEEEERKKQEEEDRKRKEEEEQQAALLRQQSAEDLQAKQKKARRRRSIQEKDMDLGGAFPQMMPHGTGAAHEMTVNPFTVAAFNQLDQNLVKVNKIPKGCNKLNRYLNILPNPRSRVRLEKIGKSDTSTYINANYIHSWDGTPREYIATQGPLPDTVISFWRMVWEQDSRAIVMVTGLKEKGVDKCARYWPKKLYNVKDDVGHVKYGDIVVAVMAGYRKDGYITSKLRVTRNGIERTVMHFWFDSWPDHGVPKNHDAVILMLRSVRQVSDSPENPWIVHCSAGIGRTGTFIAIDHGLHHLDKKGTADVVEITKNLRRDRGGMVQHPEQGQFVYDVLSHYASVYGAKDEDLKNNPVLAESLNKAANSIPPDFTIHPSQLLIDEGAEDRVPSWRKQLLEDKELEEKQEIQQSKTAEDAAERKRAEYLSTKEDKLNERRAAIAKLLASLEEGDESVLPTPVTKAATPVPAADIQPQERRVSVAESIQSTNQLDSGAQPWLSVDWEDTAAAKWSRAQVARWVYDVEDNIFADCAQAFYDGRIAGSVLLDMTEQDLKDIGVAALGDRRQLSALIQQLSKKNAAPQNSPQPTQEAEEETYITIARFPGGPKGKLAFEKGVVMVFISAVTKDWYRMRQQADGVVGLVPSNYIKKYQGSIAEAVPAPNPNNTLDRLPKPPSMAEVSPLPPQPRLSVDAPPLPGPPVYYKSLAPFAGKGKKLALEAGDRMQLLRKTTPDWFEVLHDNGQKGLAPSNYLKELSPVYFRAVADYDGGDGKLSFTKGERLILLETKSPKWLKMCRESGTQGMVPTTFVEEVGGVDTPEKVLLKAIAPFEGHGIKLSLVKDEEMILLRRGTPDWWEVRKENGEHGLVPSNYVKEFVPPPIVFLALGDYTSTDSAKLSLTRGEKLNLIKKTTKNWYEVSNSAGKRGLAPINYLKEVDPNEEEPVTMEVLADCNGSAGKVDLLQGEFVVKISTKSKEWYEVEKLDGTRGLAPSNFLKEASLLMTAVSDYQAVNADQLSFKAGDVLTFVSRKSSGWYVMTDANQKQGLVPNTYVEQLMQPSLPPVDASSTAPPPLPSTLSSPPLPPVMTPQASNASLLSASSTSKALPPVLPSKSDRDAIPVSKWTPSHVASWLRDLGDPATHAQPLFYGNDVNGAVLLTMSEDDISAIGVVNFGARRQIHNAIETELKNPTSRPPVPATAPPPPPPSEGGFAPPPPPSSNSHMAAPAIPFLPPKSPVLSRPEHSYQAPPPPPAPSADSMRAGTSSTGGLGAMLGKVKLKKSEKKPHPEAVVPPGLKGNELQGILQVKLKRRGPVRQSMHNPNAAYAPPSRSAPSAIQEQRQEPPSPVLQEPPWKREFEAKKARRQMQH